MDKSLDVGNTRDGKRAKRLDQLLSSICTAIIIIIIHGLMLIPMQPCMEYSLVP